MQELEHEAGVISFETEDILQQEDLDFECQESSNLFSWAKWVTPIIAGITSFLLSIIFFFFFFFFTIPRSYTTAFLLHRWRG